jgi:hypothetical protein
MAVIFLCLAAIPVTAEIPAIVSFQGRLTDTAGNLLSGSYNVTVRLYDAQSGGNLLWQETQNGVAVVNGIHNIYLGSVTPLTSLDFRNAYWISIELNGGGEMTPRRQVTTAPYAMRAKYADTVTNPAGLDTTFVNVTGDTMTGALVVAGSVTAETVTATRFVGDGSGLTNISCTASASPFGASIHFPDGINGTTRNFAVSNGSGYTVPAGKTLYVMSFGSDTRRILRISGAEVFKGGEMTSSGPGAGTFLGTHAWRGVMPVAGGSLVDATGAAYITAIEVDSGVTVKNMQIVGGGNYTVPVGKTLFVTSAFIQSPLTGADPGYDSTILRINGNPCRIVQGNVLNSGRSSEVFSIPMPVAAGNTLDAITGEGSQPATVYITGYER